MIIGVGVDLVSVSKFESNLESAEFLRKVFTPAEIEACQDYTDATERFAGKFAVKEAVMKSLGAGIQQGVWFNQIEVLNMDTGQPFVTLDGKAADLIQEKMVDKIHASLSHTGGICVACVILEREY